VIVTGIGGPGAAAGGAARVAAAPARRDAGDMAGRGRHCAVCSAPLPAGCSPQRRYCDAACRAQAYRERRRTRRMTAVGALAFSSREDEVIGWPRLFCPVCGHILFLGSKLRRDAYFCGGRCRTRAWRLRKAAAAVTSSRHGAEPAAPDPGLVTAGRDGR